MIWLGRDKPFTCYICFSFNKQQKNVFQGSTETAQRYETSKYFIWLPLSIIL